MTKSTAVVLDASAILVLLQDEPGAKQVEMALQHQQACMSTVQMAEVASKLCALGMPPSEVKTIMDSMGVEEVELNRTDALQAGQLIHTTRALGLSLGDRVCLALAMRKKLPALTADRAWGKLNIGIKIQILR